MADVDLMSENGMEYIKVAIPQSTAPVSFKGKFYYRSGSTVKRELKELQIKGYLEHIGPSNGGYWKVLIKK